MSRIANNFVTTDFTTLIEPFFENNIFPLAILDRNFNFIRVNQAYADADDRDLLDFIG